MLPGYLHFDVRRGLKADMLNGSMLVFSRDHQCIREAFNALDLKDITFVINEHSVRGLKGQTVHFYFKTQLISAYGQELVKNPLSAQLPKWDRCNSHENNCEQPNYDLPTNDFLSTCLCNEKIPFKKLEELFLCEKLKPSISAMALKVLKQLRVSLFEELYLNGKEALWLTCNLLMMCAQVDALDPKFITASKLCLSEKKTLSNSTKSFSIFNETWLKSVSSMMPVIEIEDDIDVDVLGIAFLKALAGQFGARGESSIIKIGVGLSPCSQNSFGHVEALWCETKLPDSITECGIENRARLSFVHEISGMVPINIEMAHFCSSLSLHGATSISWYLVNGEKNANFYHVKFFCSDDDKHSAIEAFLIKGQALDVSVRVVERHELNRRMVSVPIGTGNKTSSIRFFEYVYFDKTVRVEPLKEDLDLYVQKTDYSVDVARSDLLLAWKKWRERVIKDENDQVERQY